MTRETQDGDTTEETTDANSTNEQTVDYPIVEGLREDQIDDGLLNTARSKAKRSGHPPESDAHLLNRALWLYCSINNADEMLTDTNSGEGSE